MLKHLPAFKVRGVDTTGSGDVFHGAFAAALAWGETPAEARMPIFSAFVTKSGLDNHWHLRKFLRHRLFGGKWQSV